MQPKPMGQQWGDFEMLNGLDPDGAALRQSSRPFELEL
jgi:hypothetical protein